jgi:serine/threonine-protein kinase
MASEDPIIGRTLASRFLITALLGEGGMATVYRGKQDAEPAEIAVKIMNADLARDSNFVKRFRREARSAARLDHPCSVQIIDYGVEDGLPYIAMELLRGAELALILHHEKRLPEVRAARIMADVLSVLDAAHQEGIVHRDLKPENIMVERATDDSGLDRVKVLDFGIAKILEPDVKRKSTEPADPDEPPPSSFGRSALTMMGTIVGTPEYMSPEQSRGGAIDARSDLYSCGVLLYHLVTGKVPFLADLPFETAMLHITATPEKPSAVIPGIHPGLEALILKALEKSPDARHATAKEMEDELRALIPALATERHATIAPAPKASKLDATQPEIESAVVRAIAIEITAASARANGSAAPAAPLAVTHDDVVAPQVISGSAPRKPGNTNLGLAATLAAEDGLPVVIPLDPTVSEPSPIVAAEPQHALAAQRAPLSSMASLAIGAGLGAVVLVILALVLLR